MPNREPTPGDEPDENLPEAFGPANPTAFQGHVEGQLALPIADSKSESELIAEARAVIESLYWKPEHLFPDRLSPIQRDARNAAVFWARVYQPAQPSDFTAARADDVVYLALRVGLNPKLDWKGHIAEMERQRNSGRYGSLRHGQASDHVLQQELRSARHAERLSRTRLDRTILAIHHPTWLGTTPDQSRTSSPVRRIFQVPLLALAECLNDLVDPAHRLALSEGRTMLRFGLPMPHLELLGRLLKLLENAAATQYLLSPRPWSDRTYPERPLNKQPYELIVDRFYHTVQLEGLEIVSNESLR